MSTGTETNNGSLVHLTEGALTMVRKALADEGMKGHGLRIAVVGGGCSGYSYAMDFENMERPGDEVCTQEDLKIYIDAASCPILTGTTIDFVESIHGTGFKFDNPNFTKDCGGCSGGCNSGE
ncbi:MAG: iron-sulfur cluster assembly accessory protein [Deltaproteobacteria bacterium]|nr:iron-sulfur cluster assembly accessory protein [Deltaproteobacteria bacterium]